MHDDDADRIDRLIEWHAPVVPPADISSGAELESVKGSDLEAKEAAGTTARP